MSSRIRTMVDRMFEGSDDAIARFAQEFARLAGRRRPNAQDMSDARAHAAEVRGRAGSALRHHVSGAVERGNASPIVGKPASET